MGLPTPIRPHLISDRSSIVISNLLLYCYMTTCLLATHTYCDFARTPALTALSLLDALQRHDDVIALRDAATPRMHAPRRGFLLFGPISFERNWRVHCAAYA